MGADDYQTPHYHEIVRLFNYYRVFVTNINAIQLHSHCEIMLYTRRYTSHEL